MNIKSDNKSGTTIFRIEGNIDMGTSPDVKRYFNKIVEDKIKDVIINLEKVDYMDSSGLATFVEMFKNIRRYEGRMKLVKPSKKVKGLFEITKLDKLFEIFDNEEEVLGK